MGKGDSTSGELLFNTALFSVLVLAGITTVFYYWARGRGKST